MNAVPHRLWSAALAAVLALGLGGCAQEATYPLTGAPCGPNDPVRSLDSADYAPPCP